MCMLPSHYVCTLIMKVAVLICFIVVIAAVSARKPKPPRCVSGVIGPNCDPYNPCKKGYKCRAGRCCAECPRGTTFGSQCNFNTGQQRCGFGYNCIFGLCCASKVVGPTLVCPVLPKGLVPVCPPFLDRTPRCTTNKECGKGRLCCRGPCGRKFCQKGVLIPRRG